MPRVSFKSARGKSLVGDWHQHSLSGIVLSHGFVSDKSEAGCFDKLRDALVNADYSVLAFDYSGCGESEDDTITIANQKDDLLSAVQYVRNQGINSIGLLGYSLGAWICAEACPEAKTMVWWAPITQRLADPSTRYTAEELRLFEQQGYITRSGKRVGKKLLEERMNTDYQHALSQIKNPVLMIHGDQDKIVPVSDSRNALIHLQPGSKLCEIAGAEHNVQSHLEKFVENTIMWLRMYC